MSKGFCKSCSSLTTIVQAVTNVGLVTYGLCPDCDRLRCRHCKQTFGGFFEMAIYKTCPLCKNVL